MTMPTDDSNLDDFIAEMAGVNVAESPPAVVEEAPEAAEVVEEAPEAAESVEEPSEEQKAAEKAQKDEKSANRFTKQTRELRDAQRRIAELEAKMAPATPAEATPLTQAPEKGNDTASKAPNAENYRYGELDPQYMQDIADYRADLRIAAFRAELAEENKATQQAQAAQREAAALKETAEKVATAGSSKYADFNEVVVQGAQNNEWTLTKEMFELAAETSVAADVLYHLASNPEEADTVAAMRPAQQAMWFGRMEVKYSQPPARKVTQAPEPMASVRGAGSRNTVPDDTDDLAAFERKFFKRA